MSGWKKRGLLPSCGIGLGFAIVLTAVICLAMTPLILREWIPVGQSGMCSMIASGISVFAAVSILSRLRGRQALATAGIVSGGYLLLCAVVCALGGERSDFGVWILQLAAALAVGGLLGAVMSIRRKPGRRKRRRR